MAASGENSWPPVGTFLAAYGENAVAAVKGLRQPRLRSGRRDGHVIFGQRSPSVWLDVGAARLLHILTQWRRVPGGDRRDGDVPA